MLSMLLPTARALCLTALASSALAVNIHGTIGNPQDITRLMGTSSQVYILFASYTQTSVAGRAAVNNGTFFLDIPDGQVLKTRLYTACEGVTPSAPARVYQTETILLYNNDLNRAVGPVIQADRLVNPSKVVHWLYSDRNASVIGRCSGLNTSYDLQLKQGWNAVLTSSKEDKDQIGILYTNLNTLLPYWVSGDLNLAHARTVLPKEFFQAQKILSR
jgi:hypothetical protein